MPKRILFGSLAFTYLFFIEYLPPVRRVRIPYDLEGFHFPLADYAFQALKQGRFPEWDAAIYCGQTYVGNPQTALFYPPSWLMFLASWSRDRLGYQALQDFVFAHVWLAFVFSFLWFRKRGLETMAAALGALIYAFGGYTMLQLQHLGLIVAFAWMPLGFQAIDEAIEKVAWRPLWKLAAASAMIFLGGYPPIWMVFAISVMAYCAASKNALRISARATAALAFSFGLAMIQFLPSWEASRFMLPDMNYGGGIRDFEFFLSYFIPNFVDFTLGSQHVPGREYLYIGAVGILGLVFAIFVHPRRALLPFLAVLAAGLILLTNAFNVPGALLDRSTLLVKVVRDWYFLAAVHIGFAGIAALGLDALIRGRIRKPELPPLLNAVAVLLIGWSALCIVFWFYGGSFEARWESAFYPITGALLIAAAIYRRRLRPEPWIAAAILLAAAADFKVFGTSKRFNALSGAVGMNYSAGKFPMLAAGAFDEVYGNRHFRVAVGASSPFPVELRHAGLATPQGFDPLITSAYRKLVEQHTPFRTNREFEIDPGNIAAFHDFGVRYFITQDGSDAFRQMAESADWRPLEPDAKTYLKAFELRTAKPPWKFEGDVRPLQWTPERRELRIQSASGGVFALAEQFYPGWSATVDGKPAPIERSGLAFQQVSVPGGEHTVEFRYRSTTMRIGAAVSAISVVLLIAFMRWTRRSNLTASL